MRNMTFNSAKEFWDFTLEELAQFDTITVSFANECELYKRDRGLELYYHIHRKQKVIAFSHDYGYDSIIRTENEESK
ncbi:hypothetical protein AsFcp4_316 [Aeromonas phage AsFcp_4]|uniref:Uncharacterized protein n=1 Tax=Aeromonas phage PX29 TaxID=926067 RepID=E5DQ92_9CAUD|nr:hypothetical protein CL89_gp319 [Aeromonas phage PX29]ADQ52878.1 conserved hypothetical protein [Aeromonas phage PX29]QAX98423.1 hypothetical protein ASfcp2_79 [Aeromonas phage AsFcp_2]QAX99766.1 hypothetical protein AsFcp4_316 [Aeromonas phage AsFcp_4]